MNINSSEKEIWVTAKYNDEVFEDYQVSNLGRVKSLKGKKPKILKPRKNNHGYYQVCLCKGNKQKNCYLHRLVLCSFKPLPEDFEQIQVNHIDENKSNNCLSNLNWLSPKDNTNHASRNARIAKALSKTVFQFSLAGEFIREWVSLMEVERQLNIGHGNISKCCNGIYKTAYGYVWRYTKSFEI